MCSLHIHTSTQRHMIDAAPLSIPDGYPALTNVSTFSSKKVPRLSEVTLHTELTLSQALSLQILFPFDTRVKTDGKMGTLLAMVRKFRPLDMFFWLRSVFSMQTNSITLFSVIMLKLFKKPSYVLKAFYAW